MGHGSSGSSGRGAGKAASVARMADDDLAFSVWRRFGEKNVGFVSRRRLAPPRSHRSASSSSLSTNDTCHTIGLDLGTLSTLVITKRMCAQISGASTDDDDGAPPASLRASARSLEVFAAAGPARRPPPHEHVCAAPSERTNGARPPRSCTANDVGPFLATSIMGGSRLASSAASSFAEASNASRALASISATRAPGLGRHGASRCDACDIPTTTRARECTRNG